MNIADSGFVLHCCFNKYTSQNFGTIYWRECVNRPKHLSTGELGYLWVFENGRVFHSQTTPEQAGL